MKRFSLIFLRRKRACEAVSEGELCKCVLTPTAAALHAILVTLLPAAHFAMRHIQHM
jgi:hypothetical protein